MSSLLNQILENGAGLAVVNGKTAPKDEAETQEAGLVAPGRLSTAQLLVTLQQLGTAIQNAGEAFSKLPSATPDAIPALIEQIIANTKGAQLKAARLLTANR